MSRTRASTQIAPCVTPSKNEATVSRLTAIVVLTASPSTEWRSASSSGLASMKSPMCPIRTAP